MELVINDGSMIMIDYVARTSEEGAVFDTTMKDVAQQEAVYKEDKIYEPMLVVLGEGWVPFGLENAIKKANLGDTFEIDVSCEEAYGPKDPSKIKLVARREFQKLSINPSIGDRITLGNQTGTVISVSSGRVRMDYNHILAGKDISYKIKIHDKINGDENKIRALMKRRLPGANLDGMEIKINGSKIQVKMPEQARFYEYVQFAKKEVTIDIGKVVPQYTIIEFIEQFEIPQAETN